MMSTVASAPPHQYASLQIVEATAYPVGDFYPAVSSYPNSYGVPIQAPIVLDSAAVQVPLSYRPQMEVVPSTLYGGYSAPPVGGTIYPVAVDSYSVASSNQAPYLASSSPQNGIRMVGQQFNYVDPRNFFLRPLVQQFFFWAALIVAGAVTLATVPDPRCAEGCELKHCFVYNDDDNPNSGRKRYECTCYDDPTQETCAEPASYPGQTQSTCGVTVLCVGILGIMLFVFAWACCFRRIQRLQQERDGALSQTGRSPPGCTYCLI